MKGVILAAGKGTRLYPITHHIPKPLLPLANRPTLHYAFDRLKELGIVDICIVVGEMGPQMREELGDGSAFGLRLSYVTQTEPKGLAHAVGFAREFVNGESFALYLGDAIYSEGFQEYARRFEESGCANLNIVKPVDDPSRFGVANVDGERIVKLVEKPKAPESNLAMAGLYFFGPQLWSVLPDLQPSGRGEYEITDAIQMLIDRGHTVLAGVYEGTWFDTGTLDSFLETSSFLIERGRRIEGTVEGEIGPSVVVGKGASVKCSRHRGFGRDAGCGSRCRRLDPPLRAGRRRCIGPINRERRDLWIVAALGNVASAVAAYNGSVMEFRIETELETDGRWIAEIPAMPGVLTYGETKVRAISRATALALQVVADRIEHGEIDRCTLLT